MQRESKNHLRILLTAAATAVYCGIKTITQIRLRSIRFVTNVSSQSHRSKRATSVKRRPSLQRLALHFLIGAFAQARDTLRRRLAFIPIAVVVDAFTAGSQVAVPRRLRSTLGAFTTKTAASADASAAVTVDNWLLAQSTRGSASAGALTRTRAVTRLLRQRSGSKLRIGRRLFETRRSTSSNARLHSS